MELPDQSVYDLTPDDWNEFVRHQGLPAFRASQIQQWLYQQYAASFDEMTNLPQSLRQQLAASLHDLAATARLREHAGSAGRTGKLLLELHDGECVETVLIPAQGRNTVCISCQAGCAFDCAFCASGKGGLVRSLTSGEILAQVAHVSRLLGQRPDNIVFMGIGEPFANYEAVLSAVRRLNDPTAFGIGARHITISTCGVVPGIRRLAGECLQIELSVSLHAASNGQRSALMPVNKRWPLEDLMAACREYTAVTNRIITFEYTLIRSFNDRPSDAARLLELLRGLKCRINLIPLSPVAEFAGETPPARTLYGFRDALLQGGLNATLRTSRGLNVNAACGQLRLHSAGRTGRTTGNGTRR